jgi:hypothetical protein
VFCKCSKISETIGGLREFPSISKRRNDLVQLPKMNPLTIEPTNGTFVSTETQHNFSRQPTTFQTEVEAGRKVIPVWWAIWKFEECFDAFSAILSVAYLIGAIGFGGLLLFDTLNR